jgi:hypothetical protein
MHGHGSLVLLLLVLLMLVLLVLDIRVAAVPGRTNGWHHLLLLLRLHIRAGGCADGGSRGPNQTGGGCGRRVLMLVLGRSIDSRLTVGGPLTRTCGRLLCL